MASPMKFYLNQMKNKFGYRATWEPKLPIEVGAVGKLHQGVFVRYTSLAAQGITAEIVSSPSSGDLDYSSQGGVTVTKKLSGEVAPPEAAQLGQADAGIVVSFGVANGVVFEAKNTTNQSISNLMEVKKSVIDKIRRGEWEKDTVIVTEVIEAESATIIISQEKNGKIELKAKGDVKAGELQLANANLELEVVGHRNLATKIIAAGGLRPLFKVMGVKKDIFGAVGDSLESRKHNVEAENLQLEEVPFDEQELQPLHTELVPTGA